ncbi:MAG: N-6 DNA methylase [Bacteroidales bacterium]|jgi:type I restriction-modification system DNA methylase subunit|nr:N-6 DNA methylase [Bacteroidales bacterium]
MDTKVKEYIGNLGALDFQFDSLDNSSIYFVDKLEDYISDTNISPHIIIALDKARSFDADAVYFRFFDDGRPPMAQIYIYDGISNKRADEDYVKIHREVWSGCEIPIYMIINQTEIKVFDSRKPVDIVDNKMEVHPLDVIDLIAHSDVLKKYRAQLFSNGAFWETDTAHNHFLNTTVAAERLVKGLREVRHRFKQLIGEQSELADRLLIMCILIKYLEENGTDPESKQNLAHEFFHKNTGFDTLTDILYNNKLSDLLKALSAHFNGGIFRMTNPENKNEDYYIKIQSINQQKLAVFFDAGSSENLFGWREYSFEHIPVELISNLYEEFLPKEKNKKRKDTDTPENGAVYTPAFLVNFLIDECLPLNFNDTNENVKLIDPACGSGIFLVTAYKRLVQRWKIKYRSNGKLANPEPAILKQILKDNIFGIDIHCNSVHLTIFSLHLALCSMLKPRQIWTKPGLFSNLEEDGNIIEKDFFDYLSEGKFARDFDLIIGNPPFKELAKKQFAVYRKNLEKFKSENINLQIPFYQEALLFLTASFLLLKKETGRLCLIMKSGPFLYSGDKDNNKNTNLVFRSSLFKQYNVTQIIDFTLLKKLFRANVETAVVFIENRPAENDFITHIVVREYRSVAEKSYFELSHYDFHKIPANIAVSRPYVWKCNLLGGSQVYHLANRLKQQQSLGDYLNRQKLNGWDYGQGYKVGNKSNKDIDNILFGKNTVIDKSFTDKGIELIEIQHEMAFESIPSNSKNIFSPPHLMIKKSIGKNHIPMDLRDDYLTFRNEILGVHCPLQSRNELLNLAKQLKNSNNILRFFIAATSARSGVNRSMYTTDLGDLLNLPLFMETPFNPNPFEQIIIDDVLNYYIEEFSKGKNAVIHKKTAEIEEHIKPFSKIYCESLNKIYAKGGERYYFSKLTEGNSFFACEYTFGNGNEYVYKWSDENLEAILHSWNPSHSARYSKIMRIYRDRRDIMLVKPKKLLFWLQSTALRDFGDTLEDVLNNE